MIERRPAHCRTDPAIDRSLRDGQFDFDRRQRLTNFVMEFPGDAPSLLFLGIEQLRRELLEVAGALHILRALPAKLIFEASGVQRGQQRDAEAGGQRDAQNLPDPTLGRLYTSAIADCCWMNALRFSACACSDSPITGSRLGITRVRSSVRASIGQRVASVARTSSMVRRKSRFRPQSYHLLAFRLGIEHGDVLLQRLVG